jgi:peptide/nickel transport system permease protein
MIRLIGKRLTIGVITVLVAALLSTILVHLLPGSPGQAALGLSGTPEQIANYNSSIGWSDPIPLQFLDWLIKFVQGNMGVSYIDAHEVGPDMIAKMTVTASLAIFGLILTAIIGVVTGVTAAVRGGVIDRLLNSTSSLGIAIPSYWLAILLIIPLAVIYPIFPATGWITFDEDPLGYFYYLTLPVFALALPAAAGLARVTRAAMLDAFAAEHIRTLRAMGEPRFSLIYKHVLKLASVQIISVLGLNFVLMFGGTVMVEQLFTLPGLGSGVLGAIGQHDAPTIQATVVITTVVVVVTNLITELVIMFVDPKVRTK